MKTYLECLPCMMQQALRAARAATDNETLQKEILNRCGELIREIPMEATPPETAASVYEIVKEISGNQDAYKKQKEQHIAEALKLLPDLRKKIEKSENPLNTAVRIAIAGNIIDLGVHSDFNILEEVDKILDIDFGINHFEAFEKQLHKSDWVLYIGDNAGESVFDRLLIEQMGKRTIYLVRDQAVINDVTYQDAVDSGLNEVAEIKSSGCPSPGLILDQCNKECLELFKTAPMVISKGQGNYEALSGCGRPVFYLLKAKCQVISKIIGVNKGDIVLELRD